MVWQPKGKIQILATFGWVPCFYYIIRFLLDLSHNSYWTCGKTFLFFFFCFFFYLCVWVNEMERASVWVSACCYLVIQKYLLSARWKLPSLGCWWYKHKSTIDLKEQQVVHKSLYKRKIMISCFTDKML